jgi:hypothetical protein
MPRVLLFRDDTDTFNDLGNGVTQMKFEHRHISRRTVLKTACVGVCGLLTSAAISSESVAATNDESADMTPTELINALRSIGKPVCLDAADRLASSTGSLAGFDLHLRRAQLNEADAQILTNGLLSSTGRNGPFLRSFSASYNPGLGNVGATALAEAFPETMTELGLVGCSVSDAGGHLILEWARTAPNLQIICVEGNNFSKGLKSQFRDLASPDRPILVVV